MTLIEHAKHELELRGCTCNPYILQITPSQVTAGNLDILATHADTCRLYLASKATTN